MRTTIVIEDELLKQAMREGDHRTKRGAVDAALKLYVQIKTQARIRQRGKIQWQGNLAEMRTSDRVIDSIDST